MSIQTEISPFKLCSVKKHQGQFQYKQDSTKGHTLPEKHTLLIQKIIASSRSKGSSLEALNVENRFTQDTTFSMLIISTV